MKADKIERVIAWVLERRSGGATLSDAQIIAEHPELMPELGVALERLRHDAAAPVEEDATRVAVRKRSAGEHTGSDGSVDMLNISIPGYEFQRLLKRGGQGGVYKAVQLATKRTVAIKELLDGEFAAPHARRRFEREIELVAQLQHPSIVSIFDSGQTTSGRQFAVMGYVRGVPLTDYVREHKLPLEEALTLFLKVLDAVQYAHQKGVIHRDLKPSNILVDADGNPKVLDFGLAKQTLGTTDTVVTLTEQVVGTLPYMAPEQTAGNPESIDTRADLYALGIVLYEILTGGYPYPVVGQMADVLRHIAETEPAPLIRRWDASIGVNSRVGRSKARDDACPLDDEIQTITLKLLSKERSRRYQTVNELAADLKRYLAGDPIEAKRDSGWYVLKKNLSRYRGVVLVGALFVLLLAASAGGFGWLANRNDRLASEARFAEREARAAVRDASEARILAEAAQQQAEVALQLQRELAQDARASEQDLRRHAEMLERSGYAGSLLAAQLCAREGEFEEAQDFLASCAPEQRGFEWHYQTRSLGMWLGDEAVVDSQIDSQFDLRLSADDGETRWTFPKLGYLYFPSWMPAEGRIDLVDNRTEQSLVRLREPNDGPLLSASVALKQSESDEAAQAVALLFEHTVRIRDLRTGISVEIPRKSGTLSSLIRMNSDGRYTVFARSVPGNYGFQEIVVFDLEESRLKTLAVLNRLLSLPDSLTDAAITGDNRLIASLARGGVAIWSLDSGQELATTRDRDAGFRYDRIAVSSDSRFVAGLNYEFGILRLLDSTSGALLGECPVGLAGRVFGAKIGFDKRGRSVVVRRDGELRVWQIADLMPGDQELALLRAETLGQINPGSAGVSFAPNGGRALVSNGRAIEAWDTESKTTLGGLHFDGEVFGINARGRVLWGPDAGGAHIGSYADGAVRDLVAIEAAGDFLAMGSRYAIFSRGIVDLWSGSVHKGFRAGDRVDISVGNEDYFAQVLEREVEVRICPGGQMLHRISTAERITAVCFADSERVVVGVDGGQVQVRHFDGRVERKSRSPEGQVTALAMDRGATRLAVGHRDIRIWSFPELNPLLTIRRTQGQVWGLQFSEQGDQLLAVTDQGVNLYDAREAFPAE